MGNDITHENHDFALAISISSLAEPLPRLAWHINIVTSQCHCSAGGIETSLVYLVQAHPVFEIGRSVSRTVPSVAGNYN